MNENLTIVWSLKLKEALHCGVRSFLRETHSSQAKTISDFIPGSDLIDPPLPHHHQHHHHHLDRLWMSKFIYNASRATTLPSKGNAGSSASVITNANASASASTNAAVTKIQIQGDSLDRTFSSYMKEIELSYGRRTHGVVHINYGVCLYIIYTQQ